MSGPDDPRTYEGNNTWPWYMLFKSLNSRGDTLMPEMQIWNCGLVVNAEGTERYVGLRYHHRYTQLSTRIHIFSAWWWLMELMSTEQAKSNYVLFNIVNVSFSSDCFKDCISHQSFVIYRSFLAYLFSFLYIEVPKRVMIGYHTYLTRVS